MYLPYKIRFDEPTRTWCAQGRATNGELFGVGADPTQEGAIRALKAFVMESLLALAADGVDGRDELFQVKPDSPYVFFTTRDLFPIVLRSQRIRTHLRQEDLAVRLGITQQAYAKLERDGCNPTLETIVRLERELGVCFIKLV